MEIPTKLKIAFFSVNEGFCKYYRVEFPAEELNKQELAECIIINPTKEEELFMQSVMWADVLVFQYVCAQKHIIKLKEIFDKGKVKKLIVADFDDDYFNLDPTNTTYRNWGQKEYSYKNKDVWKDGVDGFSLKDNKERLDLMETAIKSVDVITTTTKELADRYKLYNKNVHVLKNCINPSWMPERKPSQKSGDQIVIGWQGSDSHAGDLAEIMKTLQQVKKSYGDKVKFKFMGSWIAKKLYEHVEGEFIPWTKPHLFYPRFAKTDFDIGLIPIRDTKFNRAKSNIKWLEYSYYNIPTLAAGFPPYSNTMLHGSDCLMYKHADQLKRYLCKLIDDPILRMTLAKTARGHVLRYYDIKTNAKKWLEVYKQELSRKIKRIQQK